MIVSVKALRSTATGWKICEYKDIRRGDIFKTLDPRNNCVVDPFILEPSNRYSLALEDAFEREGNSKIRVLFGTFDDVIHRRRAMLETRE